jgi:hypothetical protein
MGKQTFIDKIKDFIAGMGWQLFLWGNDLTKEEYWNAIYEQEKLHREQPELFPE